MLDILGIDNGGASSDLFPPLSFSFRTGGGGPTTGCVGSNCAQQVGSGIGFQTSSFGTLILIVAVAVLAFRK